VAEEIFKPLGLEKGIFFNPLEDIGKINPLDYAATEHCLWRNRVIQGEVHDENTAFVGGISGQAGLFGEVESVLKLTDFILDIWKGRKTHPNIRNSDLQYFLEVPDKAKESSRVLGFDTPEPEGSSAGSYLSRKSVGHLGFTGTSFWIDPERELVIVLLTNRIHPSRDNDKIRKFVEKVESQYDLIITKRLRAAQYIPKNIKTPVIIDSTDAMSLAYKRKFESAQGVKKALFWEEWKKYENYEKVISKKLKNWVVCSPKDANYLAGKLTKGTNVQVVPNVVDTYYYKSKNPPQKNTLMFSGLLGKHVNQTAIYYYINKIHPLVRKEIPDVKLNVVGPNPPKKLQDKTTKGIHITGKVPDIRSWIAKSSVVIVPVLIGTGTRNKILQAWAHERPIVSTTTGAAGLFYEDGKNILIADSPKLFAQNIFNLVTDTNLAKEIAKAGKETVLKSYSLETMKNNYEKVIKSIQ